MALAEHQLRWSRATFGPGPRTAGICRHLRKETDEAEARPDDVFEWADLIILGLDGALNSGHTPFNIACAVALKQELNRRRKWPDWRTADRNHPIEHVR